MNRLTNTLEELKESLFQNGPCLIAFPVYNFTDQMWINNNDELKNDVINIKKDIKFITVKI